ncbi:hypothetical protein TCARB_0667 [Thermofilum adornatum 1505]|uniref:Uncharacterized protein n=1 Tax=Thermofilum adornatum 1505 TaxID=697581 RepID=A0A3G1A6F7_9CREN|nr:hypothetical protein TCARB_0667 [Thermofilum adornatum 1505]
MPLQLLHKLLCNSAIVYCLVVASRDFLIFAENTFTIGSRRFF